MCYKFCDVFFTYWVLFGIGGNDMDGVQPERCHVLTYEDEEGDLVMVGDVPWE